MLMDPRVFMFDELPAGMSADGEPAMPRMSADLRRDRSRCALPVKHRRDVVRKLADRIVVLHGGCCVADGRPVMVMGMQVMQAVCMGQGLADV